MLELNREPGAVRSASGAPGAPPALSDLLPPPIDPVSSEADRDGGPTGPAWSEPSADGRPGPHPRRRDEADSIRRRESFLQRCPR